MDPVHMYTSMNTVPFPKADFALFRKARVSYMSHSWRSGVRSCSGPLKERLTQR
jgi:hypothetical protein